MLPSTQQPYHLRNYSIFEDHWRQALLPPCPRCPTPPPPLHRYPTTTLLPADSPLFNYMSSARTYDDLLRAITSKITNISLSDSYPAWTQAACPVKNGGLGIRSAVQLASSAFLASAAGSSGSYHRLAQCVSWMFTSLPRSRLLACGHKGTIAYPSRPSFLLPKVVGLPPPRYERWHRPLPMSPRCKVPCKAPSSQQK